MLPLPPVDETVGVCDGNHTERPVDVDTVLDGCISRNEIVNQEDSLAFVRHGQCGSFPWIEFCCLWLEFIQFEAFE